MQKGAFTDNTPRFNNTHTVVACIDDLSSLFREKCLLVVVIQHDGTGTGEFE